MSLNRKNNLSGESKVTRRRVLQAGSAALGAGLFAGFGTVAIGGKGGKGGKGGGGGVIDATAKLGAGNGPTTPFKFTPFTQNLPIAPIKQPIGVGTPPPGFVPGEVFHGIAPEYFGGNNFDRSLYELHPMKYYELCMKRGVQQIIPGVNTTITGYDGMWPGPTFKTRIGEPCIVRTNNELEEETGIHLHGGHNPAHSDGFPTFYVLPGQARDYYYTNSVPREGDGKSGPLDMSEAASTCWYHDHAMDLTSKYVQAGMAGFNLMFDELEWGLISSNVLPGDPYDIPIALQDRTLNPDGSIFHDPLNHDGALGDLMCANGKAQPKFHVQRRKYRFRFLNGANARIFELRLSNGQPFIGLGTDSWLYPQAIERETLLLGMAKRADVVIDFTNAPDELFLENILVQTDGRGPGGTLTDRNLQIPGFPLIKFVVEGPKQPNSATVQVGTPLRPHTPILASEIVRTRIFEFGRGKGAWQINKKFYEPEVANACPTSGTAERWILKNPGGGWWHPIHIHLESHQIQSIDGQLPPMADRFKSDTTLLGAGSEVEIFMKFRTFKGPFVFHCHNLEHEDMRMMFNFDPRVEPTESPQRIQQSFP